MRNHTYQCTDQLLECQQTSPKPYECYSSEANDVWSLGVILVNLTCGRNPWKRASLEDSTFRAYMRDQNFLQSILPISDDLNCILKRIFEVDSRRRVTLDVLRNMIVYCPQLVQDPMDSLPPTPPYSPMHAPMDFGMDPVPNLDLNQECPLFSTEQHSPTHFPSQPAITPKASHLRAIAAQPYTFQAERSVPATGLSFLQTGLFPAVPTWTRYSNLMPNLATTTCWRNISVF